MIVDSGSGWATIKDDRVGLETDLHNYVVADPDDAKEGLPQYQAGIKSGDKNIAGTVHPESKLIADRVVDESMRTRKNTIYDTTGTGVPHTLIRDLKTAGYNVKLVYVHVTLKTAKSRVKKREEVTGRGIPDDVMSSVSQMLFNSKVYIYDNNAPSKLVLAWCGNGSAATLTKPKEELGKLS